MSADGITSESRHVKNLRTGAWQSNSPSSLSPRRQSISGDRPVAATAPRPLTRGAVIGTAPQRTTQPWSTQFTPHVYSKDAFPVQDRHSPRIRASHSPRAAPTTTLVPPLLANEEIVPMNPDQFDARHEARSPEGGGSGGGLVPLPPIAAIQQARNTLRASSSRTALALASLKVSSYTARVNQRKMQTCNDAPALVCLMNGASPVDTLRRYRAFCEDSLADASAKSAAQPVATRAATLAENQEEIAELASSRSLMELHPCTYNGPFVEPLLQQQMIHAILGDAALHIGLDTVKDIVAGVVAVNTIGSLAAFGATDDKPGQSRYSAPQYHTGLPAYRFCHFFAVASDHLSHPVALRNFAFLMACFDPAACGKVPQHLILEGSFVQKFAERHVWDGVKDSWFKLRDTLVELNAVRLREADALLAYVRGEPVTVSDFTWAVETFVGSHDWHRDRDGRGRPISKALFGVPWNECRCVFLGIPAIAELLESCDLRYDRQTVGPLS